MRMSSSKYIYATVKMRIRSNSKLAKF